MSEESNGWVTIGWMDESGIDVKELRHKWLGDVRDPGRHEIRDHVLCYIFKNVNPMQVPGGPREINVVLHNEDVTCPECIELIHA
jgi:hypothetical protein